MNLILDVFKLKSIQLKSCFQKCCTLQTLSICEDKSTGLRKMKLQSAIKTIFTLLAAILSSLNAFPYKVQLCS